MKPRNLRVHQKPGPTLLGTRCPMDMNHYNTMPSSGSFGVELKSSSLFRRKYKIGLFSSLISGQCGNLLAKLGVLWIHFEVFYLLRQRTAMLAIIRLPVVLARKLKVGWVASVRCGESQKAKVGDGSNINANDRI